MVSISYMKKVLQIAIIPGKLEIIITRQTGKL